MFACQWDTMALIICEGVNRGHPFLTGKYGLSQVWLQRDFNCVSISEMGGMTLEEYEEGLDSDEQIDWDGDSDDLFKQEFRHHKNGYYMEKMKYSKVTP